VIEYVTNGLMGVFIVLYLVTGAAIFATGLGLIIVLWFIDQLCELIARRKERL
jgi:hypothetical protein